MSIKSATKRMGCVITASLVLTVCSVQTGVVSCDDVFNAVSMTAEAANYTCIVQKSTKSTQKQTSAKTIKTQTPTKKQTPAKTIKTQTATKTVTKTTTKTATKTQKSTNIPLLYTKQQPEMCSPKHTNSPSMFMEPHLFEIDHNLIENKNYNVEICTKPKENMPHYENREGLRSPYAYNMVIDQFMVESNIRYRKEGDDTYCHIFAWDVMSAMGVTLPHNVNFGNRKPCLYKSAGSVELTANGTYLWMTNNYKEYGWREVTAQEAQIRANQGYPTISLYYNVSGKGHTTVVRPETIDNKYKNEAGPVVAQAGGVNSNYGYAEESFEYYNSENPKLEDLPKDHIPEESITRYFTHD